MTIYRPFILIVGFVSFLRLGVSQDTFSMVAVDPQTGEVGSAGASCVDLANFPGLPDHFLGELFPGVGAINTQAAYATGNQANARDRMMAGDSAQEIIDWVIANDVGNSPGTRQYGIVKLVGDSSESAAHTGSGAFDYKGHRLGSNYSIQGNILFGPEILDSMEARFLRTEGDLACKMMAAMQGANVIGADSRCTPNGTSSLFAFLKISQTEDQFGEPSFVISMRSKNNEGIEPIDSLQVLFDLQRSCISTLIDEEVAAINFKIRPNPTKSELWLDLDSDTRANVQIFDLKGQQIWISTITGSTKISVEDVLPGIYTVKLTQNNKSTTQKLIIQ